MAGIFPAQADFEDMILANTKKMSKNLSFSDEFLQALPSCSPLRETRLEMVADVVYEIKGVMTTENAL